MGWWKRTKEWLTGTAGRVRALFRELPSASAILNESRAWAETLTALGDRVAAIEPQDSQLMQVIRNGAQLLEFVAPMAGLGSDKERALIAKVKEATRMIGWADDAADAWWERMGRPVLQAYIAKCKELDGFMVPS